MNNDPTQFKKTPLFLSVIFLLIACFVFFILYKNAQDNDRVSAQTQLQLEAETAKRRSVESLNRTLSSIADQKAVLETHFIQSSDVVPFLDTVEKLAPQVGAKAEVTLVDISTDGANLSVAVKASGSFEALYKFLELLENSPYQLEFTSVEMQKASEGTSSGWSANFSMKVLSFLK